MVSHNYEGLVLQVFYIHIDYGCYIEGDRGKIYDYELCWLYLFGLKIHIKKFQTFWVFVGN
jgi:hypothetical protein